MYIIYLYMYIYTDWNPPAFKNHFRDEFWDLAAHNSKIHDDLRIYFPYPFWLTPPNSSNSHGSSLMGRENVSE